VPNTCAWHRRGRLKYCRRRLKLTPRTPADSAKNPARAPTRLQGFGGYTRGCASAPPRNSTTFRREGCPISKHHPLRDPNGYRRRGSGATVGDSHRGPPKNRGKNPFSFANNKTHMNSQIINHAQDNHGPVAGAHGPGNLSGPPEWSAPAPLGRNSGLLEGHNTVLTELRLARGMDAPSGETPPRSRAGRPSGETPPRSRAGRPLGRDSASLEALTGSPLPHPLP
jgi:hypothetical protein